METGFLADDPGYEPMTLLPLARRRSVMVDGPKVKFAAPEIVRDLVRAFTAPKRALTGEMDVNSSEGVQEAANLGLGLLGVGTAWNAGRAAPKGSLATITTQERAPWLNTPVKVTGGKPGQKYVYIPDNDFAIHRSVEDSLLDTGAWAGKAKDALNPGSGLLRAHPELNDVNVRLALAKRATGFFDFPSQYSAPNRWDAVAEGTLEKTRPKLKDRRPLGVVPETIEEVLLHELGGHAVQRLTGMDGGTSPDAVWKSVRKNFLESSKHNIPDEFLDPMIVELAKYGKDPLKNKLMFTTHDELRQINPELADTIYKRYLSSMGEENARLITKLMGQDENWILKNLNKIPSFYDTPPAQQLFSKGGASPTPYVPELPGWDRPASIGLMAPRPR